MEQRTLVDTVAKHDEDLYRGNPPGTGLTTRMAVVEKELEKLARNLNKMAYLIIGSVVVWLIENVGAKLIH